VDSGFGVLESGGIPGLELWSKAENLEAGGIPDSSLAASQCSYYRCMDALNVTKLSKN